MTGPAPPTAAAGLPAGDDAGAISAVTGRFTDATTESAFRLHVWPEWTSRLRVVAVLASGLVLGFGYTDYLTLGPGWPLYACWASRLAVFLGAIALARMSVGAPRFRFLDAATFALLLTFGLSLFIVVGLQDKGITAEMSGTVLMVLGYYLFIPTRFEVQLAGALFVTLGFLLVVATLLSPTSLDLTTAGIELLICNVLGAFTALRTHVLHRREFISQRQVLQRARFEEMIARLSTRFITLPAESVESAIEAALAEVGEFTGVDRTYVFEFDLEQRQVSCLHEWCRAGHAPAMRGLQRVAYDRYAWAMSELLEGRPLVVSTLAELPPHATTERAEIERNGARSFLVLPLVYGKQVLGAIGFHAIRAEMHWSEERAAALRMVGEMIIGLLVRKRTGEALMRQTHTLEASVGALEKSNAELQRFAYVASHDLQEPLRSISSYSTLIARRYAGQLDEQANQYIGYLTAAAARMHELITNLLDYSRLDAQSRPFAPCALGSIAASAVENLQASIEQAGASVTIAPLPEVRGDPTQLLQLFQNLIGNALKFHDGRQPIVRVFAERRGSHWVFAVADNGIGIEPRHAQKIFTAFTRLHTADQYPGTGIGLAACRRIVDRHRGRIWVEPNVPHGSIFRFTLSAS